MFGAFKTAPLVSWPYAKRKCIFCNVVPLRAKNHLTHGQAGKSINKHYCTFLVAFQAISLKANIVMNVHQGCMNISA